MKLFIFIVLVVFVGISSCEKNELDPSKEPIATNKVLYVQGDKKLYSLDAETGKMLWEANGGVNMFTNPYLYKGSLYSNGGNSFFLNFFASYNADNGQKNFLLQGSGFENGNSEFIGKDNVIYSTWNKQLYASDATTGKNIWKYQWNLGFGIGLISVGSSGLIFQDNQNIICLNLNGKDVKWIYSLPLSGNGFSNKPIVTDSEIIFGYGLRNLMVLDISTGQEKWSQKNENWQIQRIGVSNGNIYLLKSNSINQIQALSLKDGKIIWENSKISGYYFGTKPVIEDNKIIVSHFNGVNEEGNLSAFNLKDGSLIWTTKTPQAYRNNMFYSQGVLVSNDFASFAVQKNLYFTDVNTGKILYQKPISDSGTHNPLISNGVIFLIDHDLKDLVAYSLKTGSKLWSFNIGTRTSSPILVDSKGKVHNSEWLSNIVRSFE
ncbi:PQQ-binding-like beta-propeller repeat protein [Lacihabitans soyangensis]|uniref:Pyrrolo-quinoline quinone repeat domain-containing protein n=1 Tax=Lacihabitans soyangensis TaxID=869394 RepID=A0AAE3H7K0_9BACT|nr:PQQ-binding-like beta-propeller repeat protein [Lacihabitans soyangensis]MCP9765927.1 hypothetical protein [Lacihabitans soyangensis]